MVGHQAVTGDMRAVSARVSGQQSEIELAILRGVEYLLAIIAALSHVMGHARNDEAGTSRHECEVAGGGMQSHGKCVCPVLARPVLARPVLARPVLAPFWPEHSSPVARVVKAWRRGRTPPSD